MVFDAKTAQSAGDVADAVDQMFDEHDVILFMKGTALMPQCGYSRTALALVQQHRDDVHTVNTLDALNFYREVLEEHSGWETIPQVYVDGEFIGGSDILEELADRGELAEALGVDDLDDDSNETPF